MDALFGFLSETPWWAIVAAYIFGMAFFGGRNQKRMDRRCKALCKRRDDCISHDIAPAAGYIFWPVFVPAAWLYELAVGDAGKPASSHNSFAARRLERRLKKLRAEHAATMEALRMQDEEQALRDKLAARAAESDRKLADAQAAHARYIQGVQNRAL